MTAVATAHFSLPPVYRSAPDAQTAELRQFRSTHAPKTLTCAGVSWNYLDSGSAPHTVLHLGGAVGVADAGFPIISALEKQFRVIAPSYPAVATMEKLCDGIVSILDQEQIEKTHLLGASFGGMIAQCLLDRHGDRFDRIVLATTAAPGALLADGYQRASAMLATFSAAPEYQVREFVKDRLLEVIRPPADKAAFWDAFVEERLQSRTGSATAYSTAQSLYACLVDFNKNYQRDPATDPRTAQEMRIISSPDDRSFGAAEQERLHRLFPSATTCSIPGGHSLAICNPVPYQKHVIEFLAGTQEW